MRITIENKKAIHIISSLITIDDELKESLSFDKNAYDDLQELIDIIQTEYKKPVKKSKQNATKKAHSVNENKSKEKIRNAVNLLNLENKKVTVYQVAKTACMSYNTVNKYKRLLIQID